MPSMQPSGCMEPTACRAPLSESVVAGQGESAGNAVWQGMREAERHRSHHALQVLMACHLCLWTAHCQEV
jgi:hypothetical protein